MLITTRAHEKFLDVHLFGWTISLELLLSVVTVLALVYAARSFAASRKSNELKTVPTLLIQARPLKTKKSSMQLVNLSSNIAYKVKIDSVYKYNRRNGAVYKIDFVLEGKNYIKGGDDVDLKEYKLKDGAVEEEEDFAGIVSRVGVNEKRPMVIRFEDVQGIKYYTEINFKDGEESIVTTPRKLTWIANGRLYLRRRMELRGIRHYQVKKFGRNYPYVLVKKGTVKSKTVEQEV